MNKKPNHRGKTLVIAVIFSTVLFLILHSNELTFQEYGNKILLNLFRIALFAPLLYFLYKKHNWARYTLAIISSILVLAAFIGYFLIDYDWMTTPDIIFLTLMFLCMLFNALVLIFSKDVQIYMNTKKGFI
jgi:hypothetical protein